MTARHRVVGPTLVDDATTVFVDPGTQGPTKRCPTVLAADRMRTILLSLPHTTVSFRLNSVSW
jgi:hypothetical protein